MKKKIYMLALSLAFACAVIGCGKNKAEDPSTALKNDIVEFVNEELPAIKEERDNAINTYNAYFSSENMDLNAFLNDLNSTAIPGMEAYIEKLSAIEVSTEEVAALKDLYLQSSRKQYEAMRLVVSAIESENPEYLTQADTLIAESDSLLIQYESQLKILAVDNGITIDGSFTSTAK